MLGGQRFFNAARMVAARNYVLWEQGALQQCRQMVLDRHRQAIDGNPGMTSALAGAHSPEALIFMSTALLHVLEKQQPRASVKACHQF